MQTQEQILQRILRGRLIAVIRFGGAADQPMLLRAVEAIVAGGIDIVEITLTTPGALKLMEFLALRRDIVVGAGSVLGVQAARDALNAGASFCASPVFDPDILALGRQAGRVMMPGAMTPTEIARAWDAGADIVKVFPMPVRDGAAYIRSVLGPMPRVRLAPSGGVDDKSAAPLLAAGAVALNVGSWLTHGPDGMVSAEAEIRERAARIRETVLLTSAR